MGLKPSLKSQKDNKKKEHKKNIPKNNLTPFHLLVKQKHQNFNSNPKPINKKNINIKKQLKQIVKNKKDHKQNIKIQLISEIVQKQAEQVKKQHCLQLLDYVKKVLTKNGNNNKDDLTKEAFSIDNALMYLLGGTLKKLDRIKWKESEDYRINKLKEIQNVIQKLNLQQVRQLLKMVLDKQMSLKIKVQQQQNSKNQAIKVATSNINTNKQFNNEQTAQLYSMRNPQKISKIKKPEQNKKNSLQESPSFKNLSFGNANWCQKQKQQTKFKKSQSMRSAKKFITKQIISQKQYNIFQKPKDSIQKLTNLIDKRLIQNQQRILKFKNVVQSLR